jgi:hypothetical protein
LSVKIIKAVQHTVYNISSLNFAKTTIACHEGTAMLFRASKERKGTASKENPLMHW